MRLFLAIELPDVVREQLTRVQEILRPHAMPATWTLPENLHITLKFLGEVQDPQLPKLTDLLASLPKTGEFSLFSAGMVCFPFNGPIKVVGVGFKGDEPKLKALNRAVEDAAALLGFQRETREYHAHTTLARPKTVLPPALRMKMVTLTREVWPGPRFAVRQFSLVESHLSSAGPQYARLAHFEL